MSHETIGSICQRIQHWQSNRCSRLVFVENEWTWRQEHAKSLATAMRLAPRMSEIDVICPRFGTRIVPVVGLIAVVARILVSRRSEKIQTHDLGEQTYWRREPARALRSYRTTIQGLTTTLPGAFAVVDHD